MPKETLELTIGEVAERSGVAPSALRYWEEIGLLAPPRRSGGQRRYDDEVLRRVELIVLAKRTGFTLADTKVLLDGFSAKRPPSAVWRKLAGGKLPEIERALDEAKAMKRVLEEGLECDCLSLEQCLEHVAACRPLHQIVAMP